MNASVIDSPWHGPLQLPNGARPMVDRLDLGGILITIEYDPAISGADLEEAEDAIAAFVERRRRQRGAAQLAGPARGQDGAGVEKLPEKSGSVATRIFQRCDRDLADVSQADPAEPGRAGVRRAGTVCGLPLVVDPTIPDGEIHAKVDGRKVAELSMGADRAGA